MATASDTADLAKADDFAADRPITSRSQDLLNRGAFADHLADAVARWHGDDSLVIALFGPWGSGKSSIKNMMLEALASRERQVDILQFNPWQFSGQDAILRAFFQELGTALGKADKTADTKRLAQKLKRYAKAVEIGQTASDLVKPAAILMTVAGLSVFGAAAAWATHWIPLGTGAVLTTLGILILSSGKIAAAVSDFLATKADLDDATLDEKKADVSTLLRKRNRTLLIVIDDIERLSSSEI
jgi:predicted KAP-like P-loop ATPase